MEKIGFFAVEIPGKLTFMGENVHFPEKVFYHAAARAVFEPEIRKCIKSMRDDFDDNIGSFDDFIDDGLSYIYQKMQPLVKFTVNQLAQNGCYDAEVDSFFDEYIKNEFDYIPEIHRDLCNKQAQMAAVQEERNAQRVARRELDVAFGGDDVGNRLYNGVGRLFDGLSNMAEEAEYYNDNVKNAIKDEFAAIAYCMTDFFADALYDSTGDDLRVASSYEEYKKTLATFRNLEKGNIPESRRKIVALEILNINPFTQGLLDWAVAEHGDADGELQKLADALYVDISVTKKYLLKKLHFKMDFSTEESTIAAKNALEKEEAKLNIFHQEYHDEIDKLLHDFDVKARSFDGVEYSTREEAATARKEDEAICTICKTRNPYSIKDFEALVDELRPFPGKTGVCQKKINELEKKIAELKTQNEKMINTLNIDPEKALIITAKMNLIASAKIKEFRCVDPTSKLSKDILSEHEGDPADIVFGMLDLSMMSNYSKGIVISMNGIYFKKDDCLLKKAVGTYYNVVTLGQGKKILNAGKSLFGALPGVSSAKKAIAEKINAVPELSKITDAVKDSVKTHIAFIPWENVSVAQGSSNNVISLSMEYDFKFPMMSNFGSKPEVELIELLNTLAKM